MSAMQPTFDGAKAFTTAEVGDEILWGDRSVPLTVTDIERGDAGRTTDLYAEGPRGGEYHLFATAQGGNERIALESGGTVRNLRIARDDGADSLTAPDRQDPAEFTVDAQFPEVTVEQDGRYLEVRGEHASDTPFYVVFRPEGSGQERVWRYVDARSSVGERDLPTDLKAAIIEDLILYLRDRGYRVETLTGANPLQTTDRTFDPNKLPDPEGEDVSVITGDKFAREASQDTTGIPSARTFQDLLDQLGVPEAAGAEEVPERGQDQRGEVGSERGWTFVDEMLAFGHEVPKAVNNWQLVDYGPVDGPRDDRTRQAAWYNTKTRSLVGIAAVRYATGPTYYVFQVDDTTDFAPEERDPVLQTDDLGKAVEEVSDIIVDSAPDVRVEERPDGEVTIRDAINETLLADALRAGASADPFGLRAYLTNVSTPEFLLDADTILRRAAAQARRGERTVTGTARDIGSFLERVRRSAGLTVSNAIRRARGTDPNVVGQQMKHVLVSGASGIRQATAGLEARPIIRYQELGVEVHYVFTPDPIVAESLRQQFQNVPAFDTEFDSDDPTYIRSGDFLPSDATDDDREALQRALLGTFPDSGDESDGDGSDDSGPESMDQTLPSGKFTISTRPLLLANRKVGTIYAALVATAGWMGANTWKFRIPFGDGFPTVRFGGFDTGFEEEFSGPGGGTVGGGTGGGADGDYEPSDDLLVITYDLFDDADIIERLWEKHDATKKGQRAYTSALPMVKRSVERNISGEGDDASWRVAATGTTDSDEFNRFKSEVWGPARSAAKAIADETDIDTSGNPKYFSRAGLPDTYLWAVHKRIQNNLEWSPGDDGNPNIVAAMDRAEGSYTRTTDNRDVFFPESKVFSTEVPNDQLPTFLEGMGYYTSLRELDPSPEEANSGDSGDKSDGDGSDGDGSDDSGPESMDALAINDTPDSAPQFSNFGEMRRAFERASDGDDILYGTDEGSGRNLITDISVEQTEGRGLEGKAVFINSGLIGYEKIDGQGRFYLTQEGTSESRTIATLRLNPDTDDMGTDDDNDGDGGNGGDTDNDSGDVETVDPVDTSSAGGGISQSDIDSSDDSDGASERTSINQRERERVRRGREALPFMGNPSPSRVPIIGEIERNLASQKRRIEDLSPSEVALLLRADVDDPNAKAPPQGSRRIDNAIREQFSLIRFGVKQILENTTDDVDQYDALGALWGHFAEEGLSIEQAVDAAIANPESYEKFGMKIRRLMRSEAAQAFNSSVNPDVVAQKFPTDEYTPELWTPDGLLREEPSIDFTDFTLTERKQLSNLGYNIPSRLLRQDKTVPPDDDDDDDGGVPETRQTESETETEQTEGRDSFEVSGGGFSIDDAPETEGSASESSAGLEPNVPEAETPEAETPEAETPEQEGGESEQEQQQEETRDRLTE